MMQAAAGAGGGDANYIEDVFSTFLYTGTGAVRNIINGIDLSGEGGMVWLKVRGPGSASHHIYDTNRGEYAFLQSNANVAESTYNPNLLSAFLSNGFTLGSDNSENASGDSMVSWTFRQQPKFFDVVTWTGSGANRTIAHNLGSVPGCIIVKRTDTTGDWQVYHRSLANTEYLVLNTTAAVATGATRWNSTTPTSTVFSIGTDATVNASGGTYVAYVFAHNAGGFGLTGADNVISCGSFAAGTGSVNLGYEPQWIMFKGLTGSNEWIMFDTMRGWPTEAPNKLLMAQSSSAEGDTFVNCQPTATGFNYSFSPDCVYIACRRGPMAVPELGTSVFSPITSAASTGTTLTTDFPVDLQILKSREAVDATYLVDRLRGVNTTGVTGQSVPYLTGNTTAAEVVSTTLSVSNLWNNTSFKMPSGFGTLSSVFWSFRRAPSFFDEVCYTGTGSARTVTHNLAAVPELMIVKQRSNAASWAVYDATNGATKWLELQDTRATTASIQPWNNTAPTSSVFTVGASNSTNGSGETFVAYLFATCAGVSKVGSYTGTATTQTINCGFTAGSRFVLIKRTDSTGDWYVWDSARGIVAGNDPYLLLNTSAAEVTSTDYVDTAASGFELSSTAPAAINASGGTFIFLAIA
jgi:hypothetical protein